METQQKSKNGILVGAFFVVAALVVIFIYAGNGGTNEDAKDINNTQAAVSPAVAPAPDDTQAVTQTIDSASVGNLEADFKEIDEAFKNL